MIYAVGLDNDKTMMHFVETAGALAPVTLVNMNDIFRTGWRFPASAEGEAAAARGLFDGLDPQASHYLRLVDLSPVLAEPWCGVWRGMMAGMSSYFECVPGRVANRPGCHVHNGAKPYHEAWLARHGFDVPAALTTSDPERIRAFLDTAGPAVCKSLCGTRGTARLVDEAAFADFVPGQGPVHIQRVVKGFDVRVHLVDAAAHGEKITAEGIDYRVGDGENRYEPIEVPPALTEMMVAASGAMGLVFTGWDFKVDADGRWWCLEVNPMPGYDSYDRRAGGAISRSLLDWLSHGAAR
jgi:hypothetical protein